MFVPPIPSAYYPLCPASIVQEFCIAPDIATIERLPGYATMAIGLCAATIGVRTFYNERVIYWRETASGTNTLVYFLANCAVDIFPVFIYSLTLACAFVAVTCPTGSLGGYVGAIFLYEYCLFGVGYICGCLNDSNPFILAVIVALISGLGVQATGVPFMWSRWAGEALLLHEIGYETQPPQVKPLVEFYIVNWKYKVGMYATDLWAMVLVGLGLRLLAYILMRILNRDKQK